VEDELIPRNNWETYLEELYQWVSEKYKLLEDGEIDINAYNDHLEYYDKEKIRIEELLKNEEEIQEKDIDEEEARFLTQRRFENFFGIDITNENNKTKEPAITAEESTHVDSETKKDDKLQVDNIWEYVEPATDEMDTTIDREPKGNEINANILLIGDSSVGRTSIRRSWTGKHFIESHLTTIGASIEKKTLELDGFIYNITLTDLGGQDFYSGLRKNFYRNIDGAVVVFDLTQMDTFRRVEFWVKEFYRETKKLVPFVLVGNKFDKKGRVIPAKHGLTVAEKYSQATMPKFRVRYTETSARSGYGVNEVFEMICREVRSFKTQNQRRK